MNSKPHVYANDVMKLPCYKPQRILIDNFNKNAIPLFQEIGILKEKNKNITKTRDQLLSRLMSGKIDVENHDIQFPQSMLDKVAT
jgi:type I restriction enzyme S subunit